MHIDVLIVPPLAPMCNVLSEVNVKSRIKWKVVLGQASHLEWRKSRHMEPNDPPSGGSYGSNLIQSFSFPRREGIFEREDPDRVIPDNKRKKLNVRPKIQPGAWEARL
jgi:hypothetical protein